MVLLEERDARVLQALVLLQVLLPDVRLDVVAENLRSEPSAVRGNAIEVLDNALPEPWKRLVMAALDETKRRGDQVLPDPRGTLDLAKALIGGESGQWVAACATRWVLDGPVPLLPLVPALRAALHAPFAPLRQATLLTLARAAPADVPALVERLTADPAPSVQSAARALLALESPRATA